MAHAAVRSWPNPVIRPGPERGAPHSGSLATAPTAGYRSRVGTMWLNNPRAPLEVLVAAAVGIGHLTRVRACSEVHLEVKPRARAVGTEGMQGAEVGRVHSDDIVGAHAVLAGDVPRAVSAAVHAPATGCRPAARGAGAWVECQLRVGSVTGT